MMKQYCSTALRRAAATTTSHAARSCLADAIDELDHLRIENERLNAEIARLRVALERVARHDLQAIALDALAPGERIRAIDMKIVDEKPDLPRSISFQVGEP